ncbi:DEAD/DEAH box helicase [Yinghuangia sp. YIM S09857]|uniref:DEAD/DEAH box helicase n=1 Tax=Yinghuangia sp. YIM S09857 TaxID=3436929 RepID=UPI003F53DA08
MDVFEVHRRLISDYRDFTSGAVVVGDQRIKETVEDALVQGSQWPDPWLSLNPSFASGGSVTELVDAGILHPECAKIFRTGKTPGNPDALGRPITFHRHQRDAIEAARSGDSYVMTTGTGSGKSLGYIVPIVDRILREKAAGASAGVKAIIVYPMNALANSQRLELRKFLEAGYPTGRPPVTFDRYTGQEKDEDRQRILDNPPDILLTNYVMLELMLTRPRERTNLIRAARGLRFLVLDELHTYRGRQGADVAMLIRRVRNACQSPALQCVGTSATMTSTGTRADQRRTVARVAGTLFDTAISADRVVGETLVRATSPTEPSDAELAACVRAEAPPADYAALAADPLARWIESTFGLRLLTDGEDAGTLVRAVPTTIEKAGDKLAARVGESPESCREAIRRTLQAGAQAKDPERARSLFAFRLHQFLSKGESVYVSLEDEETRHLSRTYQVRVPGDKDKILLPLSFCRECGQEYLTVAREQRDGKTAGFHARGDEDDDNGYLYISSRHPWPDDLAHAVAEQRFPDTWLETDDNKGTQRLVGSRRKDAPEPLWLRADGTVAPRGEGVYAVYVSMPFRFCLNCGVAYEFPGTKDFGKLMTLDQEGRSTATSVVSSSIVRHLKAIPEDELDPGARKLLSFVDNRQDASLQAGHFNDFVQVTQLRGALYQAMLKAGDDGLSHEELAEAVVDQMGLTPLDYSNQPTEVSFQAKRTLAALREVVAYRLYLDLERGWRVTMPNLEQTGLLRVVYGGLDEVTAEEHRWAETDEPLRGATPEVRHELCRMLLDELRRVRAVSVPYFTEEGFDRLRRLADKLSDTWGIPETETRPPAVGTAFPRPRRPHGPRTELGLTGRGAFGRKLRRPGCFPGHDHPVSLDDAQKLIAQLLQVLKEGGLLVELPQARGEVPGYRIDHTVVVWKACDEQFGAADRLRRTYGEGRGPRVNPFFKKLYKSVGDSFAGLVAREHTAQVPPQLRETREAQFREGLKLPILYCSPTMELGVDIADLNAVNMRNVPPTPANYAQRHGRAGRSGQPALVTTYCATGNSHDQYYFRRSHLMVAGSVAAPRLDLANEDLIRSHIHAVWLAETRLELGKNIPHILDASGESPSLELFPNVQNQIRDENARQRALERGREVLDGTMPSLRATSWWDESWLDDVIARAPGAFDAACNRWRDLFRKAIEERESYHRLILHDSSTKISPETAERRRTQAEAQLRLLKNTGVGGGSVLSDFTPYRYFASEGFLPGYSFPRLPLAAFIPGTGRAYRGSDADLLQRSRFIAIREFGPGAFIYHEGSRFQVERALASFDAGGELLLEEARVCEYCGHLHLPSQRVDVCEFCSEPLGHARTNLLPLHTVVTKRRDRISSDEEERQRVGYKIEVSYRFARHGDRDGSLRAEVADKDGRPLAELAYGDSATVRLTNLGYLRSVAKGQTGFWIDPADGRWLNSKKDLGRPGQEATEEQDGLGDADENKRKVPVIPFVQDTRNVLVLKLTRPVDADTIISLQYALERGIEAEFELEDGELDSEQLPPHEGPRDRILFIESAEGGAGVLRRLQAEPDALRRAARRALHIAHFEADGTDGRIGISGEECELGCYDCLLSFGNQRWHQVIDRHKARDLLLDLAGAETSGAHAGRTRDEQAQELIAGSESTLEQRFVAFLRERGLRLPDEQQVRVRDALAMPDFVYRLPIGPVAVFVDGPHHDHEEIATRDADASERLLDIGWEVVRIRYDDDWDRVIDRHPSVFGTPRR